MTATALPIVPKLQAVKYDGTNSADIDALIPNFTILSETGSGLTFQSDTGTHFVPVNGFIIWNAEGIVVDISNTQTAYNNSFHTLALQSDVTALGELQTAVDELAEQLSNLGTVMASAGITTFAPVAGLGSVTVTVTLTPAMPDTDFAAHAAIFGGVALGALEINSVTIVDADTVEVSITNTGLVLLGGSVLAAATV